MGKLIKRLMFLTLIVSMVVPVSVSAQVIRVEAEEFTDFYDIGLNLIQPLSLSGCSGNKILFGMDVPGEWTRYNLSVSSFGVYGVSFFIRGDLGRTYAFQIIVIDNSTQDVQVVPLTFLGQGYP